ncbi:MAG: WecB/TagA/CpsF family glycosyltransferase [Eubacteriales bacterium]|jgi:N-acetylglucosaminyldiphosphoundecaprenol N-acetyl-beta-D-mannosaminyltransferase|nr:WecB/TagA/CpsF family glycosyltransferase [Eubacteriales bacterium]
MEKVEILGVGISNVTMEQALDKAKAFIGKRGHMIFTPNPEIIMLAQQDSQLKEILNEADLLLADGIGVVIGSKIIKKPLPERVAGFDFVCRLFESGASFYLLGAKPGVADAAAEKLKSRSVNVVGAYHGYFDSDDDVISDINEKNPDVVLVCLGAPRQEKWIYKNRHKINAAICIGAGGTLDVLSGNVRRAPAVVQKMCLEWLYRAVLQPTRFKRLAAIPKFLIKVAAKR